MGYPPHGGVRRSYRPELNKRAELLDSFRGQIYKHCGFLVTEPINFARWYLYFSARQPVPGIDDQLANRPAPGRPS